MRHRTSVISEYYSHFGELVPYKKCFSCAQHTTNIFFPYVNRTTSQYGRKNIPVTFNKPFNINILSNNWLHIKKAHATNNSQNTNFYVFQ